MVSFKGESYETRPLSQPGPSHSKISRTVNGNEHQASVDLPAPVNDKISAADSNKKRSYEELYGNSIPSSSKKRTHEELCSYGTPSGNKKRSYEELFGDISDFLDTDISGIVIDFVT